jgi:2-(3-amino-3-carboxypropyl)histidine synthase
MVDPLFIDAKWTGDLSLSKEVLDYLEEKKSKKIGLFSSVNFLHNDAVKKQLEEKGMEILITKAKRTHKVGQILGCDSYHDSFEQDLIKEADTLLYVGDGMFHPEALLFAQMYSKEIKPVICWDPVNKKMIVIDSKNIEKRKNAIKANLMKYMMAKSIGIMVTVKPGQQFIAKAQFLKEKLKEKNKKAYIFVDDTFDYRRMEDYPFVEVWVNTACPRIGQDDVRVAPKPLININEALNPESYLEKL